MAQDSCFDFILKNCRPRIMKQITGVKGPGSLIHQASIASHNSSTKIGNPRPQRAKENLGNVEAGQNSTSEHKDSLELAASRWIEIRQLVDILAINPDSEAINQLARLAYDVRHSACFRTLLRRHYPRNHHFSQVMESLGKVAKYFRSAVCFIQVAANSTLQTKQIKVEIVSSVSRRINILQGNTVESMQARVPGLSEKTKDQVREIKRLLQRWRKYIVHAEMLLITYYEENPQIVLATNYIGISKLSCYLCANFIRIHNVYAVDGQHHQLYCLWTLPEEISFGSQDRSINFMRALKELQQILVKDVGSVSQPSFIPLDFLKESVANVSRTTIAARAYSLENLNSVAEAEEKNDAIISRNTLNEGEENFAVVSESEIPQVEINYEEKLSLRKAVPGPKLESLDDLIKPQPTTSLVELLSSLEQPVLSTEQNPLEVQSVVSDKSLEFSSQSPRHELPEVKVRRRPHTHRSSRSTRPNCRQTSRKNKVRSVTPQRPRQSHSRGKRRRDKVRSSHASQNKPSRSSKAKRRHVKGISRNRKKKRNIGCFSVVAACLEPIMRSISIIFEGKR